MSNVPLPPIYENHAGKWIDVEDARAHAAAVSAAKDAEIAGLRAELLKSLADNAALRDERDNMAGAIAQLLRDNRDVHEKVVRPLRERVRVLEDALREYANPLNWNEDSAGIRRVWLEPRSTTPAAYNGFEAARAALEQKP